LPKPPKAAPASTHPLATPKPSHATGHKSRHLARLSNLPFVGRSAWISRIQQIAAAAPAGAQFPRLLAFLQIGKWLFPYLRDLVHADAPYRCYPDGETGIFRVDPPAGQPLRIAVASDWATGTLEAATVAENMLQAAPHLTLHLGDVYYMGQTSEVNENCLGVPTKTYKGVTWPHGSLGSFALLGNHEMYSGGHAYFNHFLPTLGMYDSDGSVAAPQAASYFCIETPGWILLGLDTGYHSGGFVAFSSTPGIKAIPALNVDARFDNKMLQWLKQTMDTLRAQGSGHKPVLVLTHHQPFSPFESAYRKPVEQLAQSGVLDGREFVWLYGHEHRLTVCTKQSLATGLEAHPRCIGHGGMPVEVSRPNQPMPDVLYYDPRRHPIDQDDPKTAVGFNGHVVLLFEGALLTIEYRDIVDNTLLLSEAFTPTKSGALMQSSRQPAGSPLVPGMAAGAGTA